jgi:hypothetical protein
LGPWGERAGSLATFGGLSAAARVIGGFARAGAGEAALTRPASRGGARTIVPIRKVFTVYARRAA